MKKSEIINNEIEKMSRNDLEAIINGAKSDVPILNLNAVLYGVKYDVKSAEFVSLLENKLIKSEIQFFGISLSDYVSAALDILGVQKYLGNETSILRLINSKNNFALI